MIQLRYLTRAYLYQVVKTLQPNGAIVESYELVNSYPVQKRELDDQVSASIYGARMDKILRLTSPRNLLESFLNGKIDPTSDNVTDYVIVLDDRRYKVTSVKSKWVDVEMEGTFELN